jgi:hypothetical protein
LKPLDIPQLSQHLFAIRFRCLKLSFQHPDLLARIARLLLERLGFSPMLSPARTAAPRDGRVPSAVY